MYGRAATIQILGMAGMAYWVSLVGLSEDRSVKFQGGKYLLLRGEHFSGARSDDAQC